MKKNFTNPEIKIESFDLGVDVVTLSAYILTGAEKNIYSIMGVEVKDDTAPETGYVYSIKRESVQ